MTTLTEAAAGAKYSCSNCSAATENEPLTLCDDCDTWPSNIAAENARLKAESEKFRADFARDQAELASMRNTVADLKADLATAAKVTEELVDGLTEEARKRQVAEVELERLKRALRRVGARLLEPNGAIVDTIWLDGNPRSPGPTLVEFICARLGLDDLEALKEPSDG